MTISEGDSDVHFIEGSSKLGLDSFHAVSSIRVSNNEDLSKASWLNIVFPHVAAMLLMSIIQRNSRMGLWTLIEIGVHYQDGILFL